MFICAKSEFWSLVGGNMTMKNYEKPVVELVSFQTEEIMEDSFALHGHMGYSGVDTAALD